jgi:hypothetical protein
MQLQLWALSGMGSRGEGGAADVSWSWSWCWWFRQVAGSKSNLSASSAVPLPNRASFRAKQNHMYRKRRKFFVILIAFFIYSSEVAQYIQIQAEMLYTFLVDARMRCLAPNAQIYKIKLPEMK